VADVRKIGGGGFNSDYGFSIEGPTGIEVLLRDPEDPDNLPQMLFDDETTPGAEPLNLLDGHPSFNPPNEWTLWLQASVENTQDIVVELRRLEVRLHHQNVMVCQN
jgi:hypothetical protein